MIAERIDPRAWLVWAMAMSLPPMLGRNPFPLAVVLVVAIAVRAGTVKSGDQGWGRLLRMAVVFATIGVVFNVITYHGGDHVLGEIPGWIPIFGGPVTLNALVFGVLSGLALVSLVAIWSTVATQLEWNELIRLTPPGLSGIAVSSSIAVTLVPKTIEAFGEIREVQAIRGFPMRNPTDLAPLVSPLLTLGLERAVTLSEALESRGFGGPEPEQGANTRGSIAIAVALTSFALSVFLFTTGREGAGLVAFFIACLAGWTAVRAAGNANAWRPTRYRPVVLRRHDWVIISCSTVSATALLVINRLDRSALFYEPYPAISWPSVSLPSILAIALLLIPLVTSAHPDTNR
jgi:energy-coupling factor transport system permease protein